MKKLLINLCFFLACFITSNQTHAQKNYEGVMLDSSKTQGILKQCSRQTPKNISGFWNLDKSDKEQLEGKFSNLLLLAKLNLDDFAYQYVGVIIKEQKLIYINAFPKYRLKDDFIASHWKNEPIVICDGGSSFWGALFDSQKLEFSELVFGGSKGAK